MISFTPTPILFEIGPLAVRYYGLAYAIGFLLVYLALQKSSLREHADNLTLWIMLGVVAGGRIGEFIFYVPHILLSNPLEIVKIWNGGMSFHGGLIGSALVLWLYSKHHKLSFLTLTDTLVLPGAAALVLGRVANFLNGELLGPVTSVPWCVSLPNIIGCRHPSPLYEALYSLVIVGVIAWMAYASSKKWKPGTLLGVFLAVYGALRFIANFWREDVRYLGLSTGQYLSIVTFLVGIALLVWLYTREPPTTGTHKKSR